MKWETIQQLVRIGAQMVAGGMLSNGMITEDMTTTLTGAVVSIASVVWWIFWERKRPAA